MREFMREQAPAPGHTRRVARAEDDVLTYGVGQRLHRARRRGGGTLGV
jgi:hypothetical protein